MTRRRRRRLHEARRRPPDGPAEAARLRRPRRRRGDRREPARRVGRRGAPAAGAARARWSATASSAARRGEGFYDVLSAPCDGLRARRRRRLVPARRSQTTSASETPWRRPRRRPRPTAAGRREARPSGRARAPRARRCSAGPRCSSERSIALRTSSCLSVSRTTHMAAPDVADATRNGMTAADGAGGADSRYLRASAGRRQAAARPGARP